MCVCVCQGEYILWRSSTLCRVCVMMGSLLWESVLQPQSCGCFCVVCPRSGLHQGKSQIFPGGLASHLHENPVFITENDYF